MVVSDALHCRHPSFFPRCLETKPAMYVTALSTNLSSRLMSGMASHSTEHSAEESRRPYRLMSSLSRSSGGRLSFTTLSILEDMESMLVLSTAVQFPELAISCLIRRRLYAAENWRGVGLLLWPPCERTAAKKSSRWSWDILYVKRYLMCQKGQPHCVHRK